MGCLALSRLALHRVTRRGLGRPGDAASARTAQIERSVGVFVHGGRLGVERSAGEATGRRGGLVGTVIPGKLAGGAGGCGICVRIERIAAPSASGRRAAGGDLHWPVHGLFVDLGLLLDGRRGRLAATLGLALRLP